MFGKTKDTIDHDGTSEGDLTVDDFFGDEAAVAETVRVDHLHHRVGQVEQQINSQFTSLAAYAQIAQEQVEMVRSEALHANERSEQKVIALIERERSDRLTDATGVADVTARLDSLDAQIDEIRQGLQLCLSNQKALADAITDLFQPVTDIPSAQRAPPHPLRRRFRRPSPCRRSTRLPPSRWGTARCSHSKTPSHSTSPPEAPTLGAFPPPLTTTDNVEPAGPISNDTIDGPIAGLALD